MVEHEKELDQSGLGAEEFAQEGAAELPDGEAMALINANIAIPVNAAVGLNVLADDSAAYANAMQTADLDQSAETGSGKSS